MNRALGNAVGNVMMGNLSSYELKKRQLISQKRGYGPDYVNLFVKHHKEKMREFARQRDICNPIDIGLDKWGLERWMTLEEERARKEARKETRVQIQVLNEYVVALCASECLKAFFRCLILNVI